MPRWEHGSEERLKQAAMELFEEQGFEGTTAVQIAKRAGVTTRTFFRYFSDKEEVLFVDSDEMCAALVRDVLRAPDVDEPLRAVVRALAGFDWGGLETRERQRRRDAMITSNPRLLERELIKQQQIADGLSGALHQRGVDPDVAELAARVGVQVFRTAYRRWLETGTDLVELTGTAVSLLATIVPADASTASGTAPSPRKRRRTTA
jgi:AcrR family transcriptional regulator